MIFEKEVGFSYEGQGHSEYLKLAILNCYKQRLALKICFFFVFLGMDRIVRLWNPYVSAYV